MDMSSNKSVKEKMIDIYGPECWIDKLQLRPPEDKPHRYRTKGEYKRMKQLTYHHIKPKSKGGKATIENGALLSAENHTWFHKLSPEMQFKLNQIFQDYKNQSVNCSQITSVSEINYNDFISQAKNHYDRAKMKRETQRLIKEDDELEI